MNDYSRKFQAYDRINLHSHDPRCKLTLEADADGISFRVTDGLRELAPLRLVPGPEGIVVTLDRDEPIPVAPKAPEPTVTIQGREWTERGTLRASGPRGPYIVADRSLYCTIPGRGMVPRHHFRLLLRTDDTWSAEEWIVDEWCTIADECKDRDIAARAALWLIGGAL